MQVHSARHLRAALVLSVFLPGCGFLGDLNPGLKSEDNPPATGTDSDSDTGPTTTDPTESPMMCNGGAENGVCELGEDYKSCPADCTGDGASCTGTCDPDDLNSCPDECCGDGTCDMKLEDMALCPADCDTAPVCGDGIKAPSEACDEGADNSDDYSDKKHCNADCDGFAPHCGDDVCQAVEDPAKCPEDCMAAMCGNGKLEPGEVCDDGTTDNTGACVAGCTKNAECGDGFTWDGMEACDDGNDKDDDDCVAGCVAATCGDGFVQGGVEECDDMNEVDDDDCSNGCESPRLVFITSTEFKGKLNGLAGADATCQDLGGSTKYKAWLSDSAKGPLDRFDTTFTGFYKLTNGEVVAQGWSNLVAMGGDLTHAIDQTEKGQTLMDPNAVWTNTTPEGTPLGANHCLDWANESFSNKGSLGVSDAVTDPWTQADEIQGCSSSARLYCFEDVAGL